MKIEHAAALLHPTQRHEFANMKTCDHSMCCTTIGTPLVSRMSCHAMNCTAELAPNPAGFPPASPSDVIPAWEPILPCYPNA